MAGLTFPHKLDLDNLAARPRKYHPMTLPLFSSTTSNGMSAANSTPPSITLELRTQEISVQCT